MNWPEKSLWLLAAAALAAVLTCALVARDLGGRLPALPEFRPTPATDQAAWHQADFSGLFSETTFAKLRPPAGTNNPFYTAYFVPPPQPPPPKPPPPKLTRKVALTYQGFVQLSDGERRAYVLVGTNLHVVPPGAKLLADLVVQEVTFDALTLRGAAQEAVVPFRQSKELEVPTE
jgi:hypothetical protein